MEYIVCESVSKCEKIMLYWWFWRKANIYAFVAAEERYKHDILPRVNPFGTPMATASPESTLRARMASAFPQYASQSISETPSERIWVDPMVKKAVFFYGKGWLNHAHRPYYKNEK